MHLCRIILHCVGKSYTVEHLMWRFSIVTWGCRYIYKYAVTFSIATINHFKRHMRWWRFLGQTSHVMIFSLCNDLRSSHEMVRVLWCCREYKYDDLTLELSRRIGLSLVSLKEYWKQGKKYGWYIKEVQQFTVPMNTRVIRVKPTGPVTSVPTHIKPFGLSEKRKRTIILNAIIKKLKK